MVSPTALESSPTCLSTFSHFFPNYTQIQPKNENENYAINYYKIINKIKLV